MIKKKLMKRSLMICLVGGLYALEATGYLLDWIVIW